MATVMRAVAEDGVSVVLSSHVLAELGRVADYLVVVSHGGIQVAGEVEELLATHRLLTGPAPGSSGTRGSGASSMRQTQDRRRICSCEPRAVPSRCHPDGRPAP